MDNMKSGEGVVSDKNIGESIDKVCKKCGYDKAEVAELQSGESTIFIYTCLKCKAVEREVQGSSKFWFNGIGNVKNILNVHKFTFLSFGSYISYSWIRAILIISNILDCLELSITW